MINIFFFFLLRFFIFFFNNFFDIYIFIFRNVKENVRVLILINEINPKICLDHPSIFKNIALIYWQHWDHRTLIDNCFYHLKGRRNGFIFCSVDICFYGRTKLFNGWIKQLVKRALIFLLRCISSFDRPMKINRKNILILTMKLLLNSLKSKV